MNNLQIKQAEKCFESIEIFNRIAGNLNIPVNYELEYSMLKSEVLEYYEASINGNEVQQKDALADIMVVLFGTILKHGWKDIFFDVLQEVCKSNLTKFPKTADETQLTHEKYNKEGVEVRSTFDINYNVYVIKDKHGKVLKPINWQPPKI